MSPRRSVAESRLTHARIIERGIAIASVEGLDGLTIGRLAGDLGMSKAGVLGHFGTKEALQLATLDQASAIFTRLVWDPAQHARPGLPRLRAVCEAWTDYLQNARGFFPGGCLFTTASVEFDARGGPVRDAVARLFLIWRWRLTGELRLAVAAGDLPPGSDPDQIAFELIGLYLNQNQAIQLLADPMAGERTRRGVNRLLAPNPATGAGQESNLAASGSPATGS